jgi:hypothetical protein
LLLDGHDESYRMSPRKPRTILQDAIRKTAIVVIAAVCLLYVGDYLLFRIRLARNSGTIETISVYDSAKLKNGRVEVFYDVPLPETCVHSLFPHQGYNPCWYAKGSQVKQE